MKTVFKILLLMFTAQSLVACAGYENPEPSSQNTKTYTQGRSQSKNQKDPACSASFMTDYNDLVHDLNSLSERIEKWVDSKKVGQATEAERQLILKQVERTLQNCEAKFTKNTAELSCRAQIDGEVKSIRFGDLKTYCEKLQEL